MSSKNGFELGSNPSLAEMVKSVDVLPVTPPISERRPQQTPELNDRIYAVGDCLWLVGVSEREAREFYQGYGRIAVPVCVVAVLVGLFFFIFDIYPS